MGVMDIRAIYHKREKEIFLAILSPKIDEIINDLDLITDARF